MNLTRLFLLIVALHSSLSYGQSITDIAKEASAITKNPHQFLEGKDIGVLTDNTELPEKFYDLSFLDQNNPEIIRKLKKRQAESKYDDVERVYIFATRGQPFAELKDLFHETKAKRNIVVVFRGIYDDETFVSGLNEIYKYTRGIHREDMPTIQIDPTKFDKYHVNESPTMVMLKNDEVLARVKGLYSPDWLVEQHHNYGRTGDLGVYGDTVSVSEPSLLDRIRKEVGELDFEEMRETAITSYWDDYSFTSLPRARKDNQRKLDPSFMVAADVRNHDGEFIARAGEVINPLHLRRFTSKLVVFDASDPSQVAFAQEQVSQFDELQTYQLIVTKLDRTKGWDHLAELENRFERAVFLLDDLVRQRFVIQKVPSIVHADENFFFVTEYLLEKTGAE